MNQTNLPDWSALVPVMILPQDGPRHRALYAALRRLIEEGTLPPGAKLPPSRALADRLGISRGAVVAAFDMLIADGFAQARIGAGTYVAKAVPRPGPSPQMAGAPFAAADLPGDLGLATPDPISGNALRGLIQRTLMRPDPALYYYGDPRGSQALRAEVAAYLRMARGLRLHEDQIVLTAGAQGALDLVARGALCPGDAVWIEDPGYVSARAVFAEQQLVPVPVDAEGLDVAAGLTLAPQARAAYVTPSHQFPLGVTLSMRRRLALLSWAQSRGAWVIEDDYDSEFRFSGPPLAALQGMDGGGRVIYVGTFSKALMPGLRLGYLVLPPDLVDPVLALRLRVDRAPPGLIEPALAAFLAQGHFAAHLRRARRRLSAARDALFAALAARGHRLVPPDQGLHATLHLAPGSDDRALADQARGMGFGARPLSPMYLGPARPGLVLGFSGHAPDVLARAAARWLGAVPSLPVLSENILG